MVQFFKTFSLQFACDVFTVSQLRQSLLAGCLLDDASGVWNFRSFRPYCKVLGGVSHVGTQIIAVSERPGPGLSHVPFSRSE